jgi:hypothetical protein
VEPVRGRGEAVHFQVRRHSLAQTAPDPAWRISMRSAVARLSRCFRWRWEPPAALSRKHRPRELKCLSILCNVAISPNRSEVS